MKQAQRKSFDWYKMQQRFSIRKYHFGAASVLLGTALVLGVGAKAQTVQADEHYAEVTNSVSVDKIAEATKPVEVSTTKKETTYAAPTVVHPVEVTPAKSETVKAAVEKVEEPKVEKEEVSRQSAVDKSKLLTALSRAKKLEAKLYTEASAANLKASIQAGQSLLGKADATEAELSAAESSIQSAVIGLELRSNSDKGTVSETPVAKKADAAEAKEEAKPAATTTDRSVLDSAVLPTSRAAIVEAFSAPKTTNEILKPGLSLSDAHQNPAIRKEDLDKGQSGFRASSNPANPIVSGSGNTVAFADISQAGRSYSFRGYGNARGGHSIHYDVTTVRQGNRLNFTIQYSGPGEFVNNNFILDKGDGFGNPSNATITTPRLREQSKPISQSANFVSHSGYTMTSATETSMQQTIRFSLPINNPNGDLSVRLKPVTFNVDQGGGGAATSNDPYSNSNYYYRANPLYLDANPNGGSSNKVVTEDIDFQTVYLPTSKLPEGQTRLVREGEKGQRQITYKVHRFGNETILGLPISNSVTKEAKPRILQIGVAKELIDTVKPRVDQNKVGDTNNLTFYLDNDGNGVYTEGVDELVQRIAIKDGAKGEKGNQGERGLTGAQGAQGAKGEKGDRGERGLTGAQGAKGEKGDRGERGLTGAQGAKGEKGDRGERGLTGAKGEKGAQGQAGRDGVTPTVTVKDNKDDGTHTITINDGRGNVTSTVVRDGFDGASPLVATQRNEADKTTTVIFYYDQNDNNEFDAGDTKLKEVVIADGAKGEKGDKGATPKVTTARGADGHSTDITFTVHGEEPVVANIKDGKDGRTPNIDLNALAEAAVRLNNQRSGRVRRALSDAPSTAPASQPVEGTRITAYYDNNGNGKYDPGVDELIGTSDILNGTNGRNGADGASGTDGRNGAELLSGPTAPTANDGKDGDTYIDATTGDVYKKEGRNWNQIGNIRGPQGLPGPKGDKGENGRDGFTPEVTVTDNHDGSHTITVTQPEGRPALTTIVKNGVDGQTPKVKAERDEAKKQTTLTFYIDKDGDGNYTEGTDTLVQTSIVKDGQDGAAGQAGRDGKEVLNGKVAPTPRDGKDGDSFVNTATGDVFVKKNNTWEQAGNIKGPKGDKGENGRDGFTPEVSVTDNHDGSHTITVTQPEGRPALTTIVKNGVDGQTPKVKAERDEAKKQTTLTFYIDKDGDGNYTEGTDTLVQTSIVKDGQDGAAGQAGRDGKEVLNGKLDPTPRDGKDGDSFVNTATGDVFVKKNNTWEQAGNIKGPKGDKGENGRDGFTPEVTVTDNHDGSHTITVTQPEGRPALTTIVKNGVDGQTPKVKAERDEAKKQTTLTFYIDKDGDGNYTEGTDTLVQTSIVKDGQDGAAGQAGRDGKEVLNGKVAPTPRDGKDGDSFVNTATGDVFVKKNNTWEPAGNIKGPKGDKGENGRDGFTPEVTVTDNHDGTHTITITQPEGRPALTTTVKNGENGQTPKVKAERDEAKKQTTLTFYIDKDGDGNYTEGTDTLVQTSIVKDGQDGAAGQAGRDGKEVLNGKVDPTPRDGKDGDSFVNTVTGDVFVKKNNTWEPAGNIKGPKGDKGESGEVGPQGPKGEDGKTPEVTVTPGKDGHSSDITFTVPGKTPVTVNVKDGENGLNGKTPKVDLLRVEGQNGNPSHTIVTFYTDENGDGKYTVGTDELLGSEMIKDGAKGADGRDGKSLLTVKEGKETKVYQEDPANPGQPLTPDRPLAVIRDGIDGKSPTVTAARKEEVDHKGVEITVDNHDGSQPTTVFVHDGAKGETGANGQNGQTPTVTTQRGADGHSTVVTITTPGKEPVTFTVRDGLDGHNGNNGRTPKIDLQPYINGEDSFRRARRSVGNNPDEASEHPNSRATSSDNADGTHVTVYFDNNGNNHYDPGVDELISERDVLNGVNGENGASGRDGRNGSELLSGNIAPTPKDGKNGDTYIDSSTGNVYKKQNGAWNKTGNIRGPQGAKGDTPEVTAKPGADGHSTDITITTPGKDPVTVNVKNGKDGKSLIAKKEGNETKIFVEDPANPGQPLDATKPLATVLDGLKGEKGDNGADGKSPVVTMTDNGDGTHSITVRNGDGSESTTKVKDGKDGKTATITTTENPDGSHTITVTNPDGSSKETVVKNGKDGKTPKVEVTDNNDGTHTVKVTDGDGNVTNAIIKDGKDGKAATATTTEHPDGSHTVTITNPDGTKNEFVVKNGRDGVDGRTPTASVRDNGDGSHTIVITNPEGVTTETTVHDGKSPKVTITDEQNGTHKISVLNGDGTTTETIIKDGKSPVATVTDNHDGTYTIHVENGNGTVSETTVRDGKSPTAKVVDNGDGTHTITVVNSDGTTTTTTVRDGKSPKLEVIDNNNGSHTIKVTGTDGKETTTTTTIFDGKTPKANIVDNGDGTHTLTIVDSDGREYKSIIKDGKDGKDGVSPTVTVKNNNDGTHVVTIINPDGSKTEMVIKDGKDGKSPKVSVEDNGDGSHTITIINSDGTVTKTVVKDGKDGRDGRDGKDGKDGKCGCQDKPVPPTPNVPERPMFAMPEPPVHELPEYTGGVTPLDPPVYDKPEFNGGVPGMPEVTEVPELDIPTVPAQPIPNVPTPEVPVQPVPAVPEQPVVPTPAQPATPVNANPVVPTTVKENHGDKLPETGSQSDYISVLLGSGILLSLYVGRRKED